MNKEEEERKLKELKIIFIGTSDFAVPALKKLKEKKLNIILTITQPDKKVGRKKIITPSPIKKTSLKLKIPCLTPDRINDIEKEIKKNKPDMIITASYGQIIPKNILKIPKYGSLNIHPSLLPKYRGPSPIQSAILNNDKTTGVSIMLMDEKMDHGPILKQKKLKINNEDYPRLSKKLADLGAELLIETIPNYLKGKLKPKEQDHQKATYTKIITKNDGKINWNEKAKNIQNKILAYSGWPGTWSLLENKKKIKILKSSILENRKKHSDPGKISENNKKMTVECGQGTLILERIQIEGKKEITGEDFLRGYKNFQKLL